MQCECTCTSNEIASHHDTWIGRASGGNSSTLLLLTSSHGMIFADMSESVIAATGALPLQSPSRPVLSYAAIRISKQALQLIRFAQPLDTANDSFFVGLRK